MLCWLSGANFSLLLPMIIPILPHCSVTSVGDSQLSVMPVSGPGPDLTFLRCCCCRATFLSLWERKAVRGERSLDLSVVAWYPKSKHPTPTKSSSQEHWCRERGSTEQQQTSLEPPWTTP